jgi:hypothetical protein
MMGGIGVFVVTVTGVSYCSRGTPVGLLLDTKTATSNGWSVAQLVVRGRR